MSNVNLTASQTDYFIARMASAQPFLVANWRLGEPIIHGWGTTPAEAVGMARSIGAPQDSEVCSRVLGESLVWQGPSARKITLEHWLTVD